MGFKDIFRPRPQLSEAEWAAAQAEGEVFAGVVGAGPEKIDQPNPSLKERMIADELRRDPALTPRLDVVRQFVELGDVGTSDPSSPPIMPDSRGQNS